MEAVDTALLQAERADVKLRGPVITKVLRDDLAATALVQERSFSSADVGLVRQAMLQAAPFAHPKVFPSYWEHILYSSITARYIAGRIRSDQLQPYEAEILQLLEDVGSLIEPHHYFRKNVINSLLYKNIGIRPDLTAKHPPIPEILGRGQAVNTIDALTLPQIILDLVDNIGKLNADGTPFSISQMRKYDETQPGRYTGGIFASERFGRRALTEGGKQKLAIDLVFGEIELLKAKGVDIEQICQDAFEEFSLPENQRYLRNLKQAQESLDPKVDQLLGKPPIKTIAFDAGGVLFRDANPDLFRGLARFFNRSYDDVIFVMNNLNPKAFGNKIGEEEYLRRFWEQMGKQFPGNLDKARAPFIQPAIYHPKEGMTDLVKTLAQNPEVQLYILSDCIHAITPTLFKWIVNTYPQISPEHIFISSQINAAKKESNNSAFQYLLERLGNPKPQSVLFIDDNPVYTTNARAKYDIRSMHFTDNDPQRLKEELTRAKLI